MENNVAIAPQQRKVFPSIDLTKFVLAFFVVGIHARSVTLVDYHPVVWYFCNFAVTYFFLASGFFFRKKWLNSDWTINEDLTGIKSFVVRIMFLFFIWSLLYLPSEIYNLGKNEHSLLTDIGLFSIDFLLKGKVGFGITLWYLHSRIVGGGIIYLLAKLKVPFWGIFCLSLLLFIISTVLNDVLQQDDLTGILYRLSQVFGGSFSRLFAGFFLLLVGAVMNVYQEKLGVFFSIIIIAISVLMFAFDVPFSSLVSAVGFLSLSVSCPLAKKAWLSHLRNYSILIYLLHMFFIMLLSKGFAIASTAQIWIGAFVLSVLIASVILSLSHRFRILKMLY